MTLKTEQTPLPNPCTDNCLEMAIAENYKAASSVKCAIQEKGCALVSALKGANNEGNT